MINKAQHKNINKYKPPVLKDTSIYAILHLDTLDTDLKVQKSFEKQ